MTTFNPEQYGPHHQDLDDLYTPDRRLITIDSRIHGIDLTAIAYKHTTTIEQVERCHELARELIEFHNLYGPPLETPESKWHIYEDQEAAVTESAVMAGALMYNRLQLQLPLERYHQRHGEYDVELSGGQYTGSWRGTGNAKSGIAADILNSVNYPGLFQNGAERKTFARLFLDKLMSENPPVRDFNLKQKLPNGVILEWRHTLGPGNGGYDGNEDVVAYPNRGRERPMREALDLTTS